MAFAGKAVGVSLFGRAGVAEQGAEDIGEEIREQGGFLEIVGAARSHEAAPVLEFRLQVRHALRQVEGAHLLADNLGVEERFGFNSHLLCDSLHGSEEKPSALAAKKASVKDIAISANPS